MAYVRLVQGVVDHFPARASEWFMSYIMIAWGLILLKPNALFASSLAWRDMALIASETTWGWLAIIAGVARLLALIVNGSFPHTWYGKWSPKVRSAMSALSMLIWISISIGLFSTVRFESTGLAIYPGLAMLDFWNVLRAASDAGYMDEGRKNGIP